MKNSLTENSKRPTSRAWFLRIVMAALVGIMSLILILALIGPEQNIIEPLHDPALLATAQALLQNPEPESEFVTFKLLRSEMFSACIFYHLPTWAGLDIGRWIEVYVNNEPSGFGGGYQSGPYATSYGRTNRCTLDRFKPGIHLVEVRLKTSPFEEPFDIHRWAFEIEE